MSVYLRDPELVVVEHRRRVPPSSSWNLAGGAIAVVTSYLIRLMSNDEFLYPVGC